MSELSPEARVVLAAAAPADLPSATDRARMDARLAALGIAAAAGSAAAPSEAASAPQAAPVVAATHASVKLAALALALVAAGLGTRALVSPSRAPAPRTHTPAPAARVEPHVAPAPAPVAQSVNAPVVVAPVAAPAPTAPTAPAESVRPRVAPATVAVAATHDDFAAEVALLREAHAALREGRPGQALAQLGHASPGGALREEFLAARVVALCALGREGEARAEAARLAREAPGSPMLERLQRSCALAPNAP